jgi:hypothetical protein
MTFIKRLKFFGIGSMCGVILLLFIFNKKESKCSYFPNERVIAESLSKTIKINTDVPLKEDQIRKLILPATEINFKESKPDQKPCRSYIGYYPKEKPSKKIAFELCKDEVVFTKFENIK